MMTSGKWTMVNMLENWRPIGWFYLDLAVYIIYSVILASLLFISYLQVKRKRRQKPLRWKGLAATAGVVLLVEFLAGSFFLWVFNAAGRSVTVELDSPAITLKDENVHVSVNKMRMRIPNGQSNGISTSTSHFELVAVDIDTGQSRWHRKSFWQEYVIGNTSQGILTVNTKKEKLQFIDPRTGKTALTEKELVAQYPELSDNLSYSFTDYRVVSPDELYLYALDGNYYRVDFTGRKVSSSAEYKAFLSTSFANTAALALSGESTRAISTQLGKLYPELLEMSLLHAESGGATALIGYHEKRNEKTWTVSLVSLQEPHFLWKTRVDDPGSGLPGHANAAIKSGNAALILTNGKQYNLNWETGKIVYEYIYRWNKTLKD